MNVAKHVAAHIGFHVHAEHVPKIGDKHVCKRVKNVGECADGDDRGKCGERFFGRGLIARQQRVDCPARHDGECHIDGGDKQRAYHICDKQCFVRLKIRKKQCNI